MLLQVLIIFSLGTISKFLQTQVYKIDSQNLFIQFIILLQMSTNNEEQLLPNSILQKILQSYSDLQYHDRQLLKKYLSSTKICTALIRESIIEQGYFPKKGIMVIQGTLMITKKVANGRIIFSQLNYLQIANIEVFLYNRAYYSATVQSSLLKYIEISEPILKILFQYMKQSIQDKQRVRNKEIQAKLREVAKSVESRDKQKMLDRLTLPALKFLNREDKNVQSTDDITRKLMNSPKQNNQKKLKLKKSYSLSKKILPKALNLKQIQVPHKNTKHTTVTESAQDRNERIFKQQLKAIIKRKLVYERKQLGVLKAYRQNHNDNKVIYEQDAVFAQTEDNDIDQYFKF